MWESQKKSSAVRLAQASGLASQGQALSTVGKLVQQLNNAYALGSLLSEVQQKYKFTRSALRQKL